MQTSPVFGVKEDGIEYVKRTGSYAVICKDETGEVALVKNEKGHYFLPGGGIKEDESLEGCIRRECIEEIGFKVNIKQCIGSAIQYFQSPNNHEYYLSEAYFYICNREEQQNPAEKGNALVWMKPIEAIKWLVHEHHKWAILNSLT
ncbi:NUDIX domain-containing protein [Priestia filamentosa]|uniref:NUDIX domain-containing protein n=1 Tax=Priestia filamentosa TaxID=1402861 RepID=UPI0002F87529|nr:NUDIX domain-containing protein [Priestia filamentosa]